MRFIDTKTRELVPREFGQPPFDDENFRYAVLSHSHSAHEVRYRDMDLKGRLETAGQDKMSRLENVEGFKKIEGFCNIAARKGCDYCWLDSACLDWHDKSKGNEAIVSMYRWFQHAYICCVHLVDVKCIQDLKHARWFTRSWSLVELLAPKNVVFYDHEWNELGSKESLASLISEITKIPVDVLKYERLPKDATIGEKLSWASERESTLEEERVYALISLLNVKMATDYGEGSVLAYYRMQGQILTDLEDYTILMLAKPMGLATKKPHEDLEDDPERAMMKPVWRNMKLISPINLVNDEMLRRYLPSLERPPDSPQLTARGLRVTLFAKHVRNFLIAWTYCTQERGSDLYAVCIRVVPIGCKPEPNQRYLHESTSGLVCYVAIDRLRSFKLKDIYFSIG